MNEFEAMGLSKEPQGVLAVAISITTLRVVQWSGLSISAHASRTSSRQPKGLTRDAAYKLSPISVPEWPNAPPVGKVYDIGA